MTSRDQFEQAPALAVTTNGRHHAATAYVAYVSLVRPGINHMIAMWPLFSRTRATLKEDLEWLQQQRTRSTR